MMSLIAGLAAGILSGVLVILASPTYGLWWAGLLSLLPVYFARLKFGGRAAVGTAVFAAAFAFHYGRWFFTAAKAAPILAFLLCAGFALIYFVVIEAAAAIGRGRPGRAPLALPALWVAVDIGRTATGWAPLLCFPSLAHTQVNNPPLLHLASWGGVPLVTFVTVGAAAAVAYWLVSPLNIFRLAWAAVFVAAYGAAGHGGYNAAVERPEAAEVTVTCVQNGAVAGRENYDFLAFYEKATDETLAPSPRPEVVIWPETLFCRYDDDGTRAAISSYATTRGVYIAFDSREVGGGKKFNTAVMVDPSGREVLKWRKRRPAPGERSNAPPKNEPFPVYKAPWGPTAMMICYDDYFSAVARRLATAGACFFLIPSNDAGYGDDAFYRFHINEAVFRAVENKCAVAVAGYDGYSVIADDVGRVHALKADHNAGWITARVPVGRGGAYYTRHPGVFKWTVLAAAALLLLGGIRGRRGE